jgi:hypothetical protein
LNIVANNIDLHDLDEFSGCDSLKSLLIEETKKAGQFPSDIVLDLQACWLDYGFSHLYLDEALSILIRSTEKIRKLTVKVSVDLGERHFMAALLFPQSRMLQYKADQGPNKLADLLDQFGRENNLSIKILSFVSSSGVEKKSEFLFGQAG